MKTIKLSILLLCSVLVFNSCSKDDDETNDSSTDISGELTGIWRLTELNYGGSTTFDFQGSEFVTEYSGEGLNIDSIMEFTEDPNDMRASGSYDVELTSSVQGQESVQTVPVEDFESIGTWNRDGDILTVEGELVSISTTADSPADTSSTSDYTITELTDTTLRLTLSQEEDITQNGLDYHVVNNSVLVLVRQ